MGLPFLFRYCTDHYLFVSCEKIEMNEIEFLLNKSDAELFTITDAHIAYLPQPIQSYIHETGVVGKQNSNSINVKIVQS